MQDRAVAYCNQTKAQPLSWQLCLEKYSSTAYMEVRFWCLQTLHEVFPALPSTHQHQSEVLLLLWQLHAIKLHSQLSSVTLQVLITRYDQLDSNVVSLYPFQYIKYAPAAYFSCSPCCRLWQLTVLHRDQSFQPLWHLSLTGWS